MKLRSMCSALRILVSLPCWDFRFPLHIFSIFPPRPPLCFLIRWLAFRGGDSYRDFLSGDMYSDSERTPFAIETTYDIPSPSIEPRFLNLILLPRQGIVVRECNR